MPKRFFLTKDSVTGAGPRPAGYEITHLYAEERTALCLMGRARAVDDTEADAAQAEIAAEIAAAQAAEAARYAEEVALIEELNSDTPVVDNTEGTPFEIEVAPAVNEDEGTPFDVEVAPLISNVEGTPFVAEEPEA